MSFDFKEWWEEKRQAGRKSGWRILPPLRYDPKAPAVLAAKAKRRRRAKRPHVNTWTFDPNGPAAQRPGPTKSRKVILEQRLQRRIKSRKHYGERRGREGREVPVR